MRGHDRRLTQELIQAVRGALSTPVHLMYVLRMLGLRMLTMLKLLARMQPGQSAVLPSPSAPYFVTEPGGPFCKLRFWWWRCLAGLFGRACDSRSLGDHDVKSHVERGAYLKKKKNSGDQCRDLIYRAPKTNLEGKFSCFLNPPPIHPGRPPLFLPSVYEGPICDPTKGENFLA